MQTLFRSLRLMLPLATMAIGIACYPHVGTPYGADDEAWIHHAIVACERGDKRAHDALMARAGAESVGPECTTIADDHDTTLDDRR